MRHIACGLAIILAYASLVWGAAQDVRVNAPAGPAIEWTATCGASATAPIVTLICAGGANFDAPCTADSECPSSTCAAPAPVLSVTVQNRSATENVFVGLTSHPVIILTPMMGWGFDVKDIAQLHCKRGGSVDVTLGYSAIKGP